jgi:hypothetical protein
MAKETYYRGHEHLDFRKILDLGLGSMKKK